MITPPQVRKTTCPGSRSGRDKSGITPRTAWHPSPVSPAPSFLPPQSSGGLQGLLLPQNQFAMFLYCFIFIHMICVTKEMIFFLFSKHYLFCIVAILLRLIKMLRSYFQVPSFSPSLGTSILVHDPSEPPVSLPPPSLTALPLTSASLLSELAVRKGSDVNRLHLTVKKYVQALY